MAGRAACQAKLVCATPARPLDYLFSQSQCDPWSIFSTNEGAGLSMISANPRWVGVSPLCVWHRQGTSRRKSYVAKMGDRGNVYYAPTGETTEWEDILIKKGILAPKTKVQEEEEEEEEVQVDPRENATLDELDEMEDDFDDDKELERIRERRIAEMKAMAARNKFGDVQPITKDEWTREVTDGSSDHWVIAHLWDTAVQESRVMEEALRVVAKNHRDVKFVSIQGKACIENWPARNCPTLFMYHKGALQNQLLGIRKLGGVDMKAEDLEEHLASCGVFRRD